MNHVALMTQPSSLFSSLHETSMASHCPWGKIQTQEEPSGTYSNRPYLLPQHHRCLPYPVTGPDNVVSSRSSVPRISVFTTSLCTCPSFLVEHNSHLHQLCSTLAPCTCLIPVHFSTSRIKMQTNSSEMYRISEHEEVIQKGNKIVFKCLRLTNWFI